MSWNTDLSSPPQLSVFNHPCCCPQNKILAPLHSRKQLVIGQLRTMFLILLFPLTVVFKCTSSFICWPTTTVALLNIGNYWITSFMVLVFIHFIYNMYYIHVCLGLRFCFRTWTFFCHNVKSSCLAAPTHWWSLRIHHVMHEFIFPHLSNLLISLCVESP